MDRNKTYYIENLGCAKNQVDAEVMIAELNSRGWCRVLDPGHAELIIVNTCGFIEPAKEESVDVLISFRDAFPDASIIAAGCLSQRYNKDLSDSMPELDGIFGNYAVSEIGLFAEEVLQSKGQGVKLRIPDSEGREDALSAGRTQLLSGASSAYVKLAEGCSNNCSFCAIPLIRGTVRSRKPESIVEEIRNLTAELGIREINLIAQDLGSYGEDLKNQNGQLNSRLPGSCMLPDLLEEINKIPGDFFVRMLYIHPDKFPLEILDICAAEGSRIVPYFDIPFQHASAPVLSAMNRRGSSEKYLELLSQIRRRLPDAVVRTTFMLGFPGESRADVAVLQDFISRAQLEWAGFFVYSREEDTPAYRMEGPGKLKRRAKKAQKDLAALQELQSEISTGRMQRFVGTVQELLVEEAVEQEDLYLCRSWMQAPDVDGLVVLHADEGSLRAGETVRAEITGINGIDLEAELA